jgi:hypothetical protein
MLSFLTADSRWFCSPFASQEQGGFGLITEAPYKLAPGHGLVLGGLTYRPPVFPHADRNFDRRAAAVGFKADDRVQ